MRIGYSGPVAPGDLHSVRFTSPSETCSPNKSPGPQIDTNSWKNDTIVFGKSHNEPRFAGFRVIGL
ncbi:MAG: hypothetical protein CVV30_04145 [Methanomicrobiales archaeon HGW-Methanomicrobiales-1]|nr:MAG: hypothetical protein CVV30_04145 [Methanomicrobiales archaeon HGW-Methanomicrobiales-1]